MLKILIINDNLQDKACIKSCFGEYDVLIYDSTDIETGYGLYEKYKPHIVILDLDMKGNYSPFDFLDLIESHKPALLIVTSNRKLSELEYCMSKGVNYYIFKPVDCGDLTNQLEKLCIDYKLKLVHNKVLLLKRWTKNYLNCLVVNNPEIDKTLDWYISGKVNVIRGITRSPGPDVALLILKYMHRKIDVVFIDYRIPNDGMIDFVERVFSSPMTSHLPMILVGEDTPKELVTKALQVGVTSYINIPFTSAELSKRVNEVLP